MLTTDGTPFRSVLIWTRLCLYLTKSRPVSQSLTEEESRRLASVMALILCCLLGNSNDAPSPLDKWWKKRLHTLGRKLTPQD